MGEAGSHRFDECVDGGIEGVVGRAGVGGLRRADRCDDAAIAHLPPEAREIYRNRIDGLAERWFRQGASQRDLGQLRRVVDQAFCSSWGDDSLELLGDLAFQDGRFGESLAMYRRLVADRPGDATVPVHPDPSVDLARVAAKKIFCRVAAGEEPPGKGELDEFARFYPGAAGTFAGRNYDSGGFAIAVAKPDQLRVHAEIDTQNAPHDTVFHQGGAFSLAEAMTSTGRAERR